MEGWWTGGFLEKARPASYRQVSPLRVYLNPSHITDWHHFHPETMPDYCSQYVVIVIYRLFGGVHIVASRTGIFYEKSDAAVDDEEFVDKDALDQRCTRDSIPSCQRVLKFQT